MHYWQFNNSDWAQDTAHLTPEEEGIYLRLCRYYYDTEKPIPLDTDAVFRRLLLSAHKETALVILEEFFEKTENKTKKGFFHKRIESELKNTKKEEKQQGKMARVAVGPEKDAASSETEKKPSGFSVGSESKTQTEPTEKLTKNHKPITNNQEPEYIHSDSGESNDPVSEVSNIGNW